MDRETTTRYRLIALATLLAGALAARAQAAEAPVPLLWIEGESAQRHQVHGNPWFESVAPEELSGGAQIANFSEPGQPEGWAEHDVDVPQAGAWHFWLRANPCTGLLYKLDAGGEVALDPKAMQDEDNKNRRTPGYVQRVRQWFNVAADGTHDARTVTWYCLGKLDLAQGKHTLRFSLGGRKEEKRFAAIDCFVLTTGAFEPNFQYKPGEQPRDLVFFKEGEAWAFDPPRDAFSPDALLDLRGLNEQVAGEHGFVRLSEDGNDFVRGDGQPIRFWGGSTYTQRIAHEKKDQAPLEHHARFLAKRGVNIVRLHGAIPPDRPGAKLTDVNEKELDEIYRLVAAMKKAGIYTIISPYWGSHSRPQKDWGVADAGNNSLAALVFFDPVLQQGYKAWLKRIYADPNPYTGIPLAKDPAVAIIQLQNEDSMLFWTMQRVKGQAYKNLCTLYGDWLKAKYGSLEKAQAAWKGDSHEDDDLAHGRPGMYIVWFFTLTPRSACGPQRGAISRGAIHLQRMCPAGPISPWRKSPGRVTGQAA